MSGIEVLACGARVQGGVRPFYQALGRVQHFVLVRARTKCSQLQAGAKCLARLKLYTSRGFNKPQCNAAKRCYHIHVHSSVVKRYSGKRKSPTVVGLRESGYSKRLGVGLGLGLNCKITSEMHRKLDPQQCKEQPSVDVFFFFLQGL